jgi:hypothetical protein
MERAMILAVTTRLHCLPTLDGRQTDRLARQQAVLPCAAFVPDQVFVVCSLARATHVDVQSRGELVAFLVQAKVLNAQLAGAGLDG